jgi:catechol 2,3-dioxygenase-like lactoylglutathione lyase family enzyme
MASDINHVSIHAPDLQESVGFYVELLEAEPIPTPNFGVPVQWLAFGRTQLHLFQRDLTPTSHHHLGITVEDLERPYRVAERRDAFEREAFGNHLVLLPGDVVQLYVRDPGQNLVELDFHGAERLPAALRAELVALSDLHPQSDDNLRGRLFVPAHALDRP